MVSKEDFIKYGALVLLVLQNAAVALVTSYSRSIEGPKYLSTTAVINIEIIKFILCHLVVFYNEGFDVEMFVSVIYFNFNWHEILLISVPAFVYTIQNNLMFIALDYLDPTTFQLLYQGKILTTALFSVVMLKKVLSRTQWVSLFMLTLGVALTQLSKSQEAQHLDNEESMANLVTGFSTVMLAICLSGFAGVYFEKILKKKQSNVWLRNIQLGMTSILLSLGAIYFSGDIDVVVEQGFFYGYTPVVWTCILLQAVGGLLVAVVVKYADNILKGFAASFAVVVTFVVSMYFSNFYPNQNFYIGAVLINVSIYLYSTYPDKAVVVTSPRRVDQLRDVESALNTSSNGKTV
mmetsp:Transcript_23130/g.39137  ORF Transcript_23130/g.39137 Transcript_23130/m.39137 type:complete len:349 (+) Transcript_23130:148-1194(+)|eukprot:CAMPEP_0114417146 /NCGR_PEP_ID=MMETSP0103-20121206/2806_1 /TAXON_ID=37642 ORGANISM="Paraphysomonas imperforata, Strain PA2" /NCGR_SAMPLE_ID=MMETSP0103 /ASSEMBLY_ACC=CAM_ASM_000201 /LENGTH=348 /DNA_ID=CAMNT_0001585415 /DNA_START=55 /DNA_END=1101 /DNA_ORIENTATION=+